MEYINNYYNLERTSDAVNSNTHRALVGGLWDEIGSLQYEFLLKMGLKSDMRIIDIGCGCLRVGVHLVNYLDSGNYYGTDISQDLLDVGHDVELAKLDLQDKLPKSQLQCDKEFRFEKFGVSFDFALALSVFTHLPLNHIMLCLKRLTPHIKKGGMFFATFFLSDSEENWENCIKQSSEITTYPIYDPYHYRASDIEHCISGLPWELDIVGDWNHPRNQKMVIFKRI